MPILKRTKGLCRHACGFFPVWQEWQEDVLETEEDSLWLLRQSPRAFWKYITAKLQAVGLEQSKFDPCLFIGPDVICVVYVDDLIFWYKEVPRINRVAMCYHST